MLNLAVDGITSFSIKPIRHITVLGMVFAYAVNMVLHRMCSYCLGIVGEYVGKTYVEAKERPRFIIQDEI